MGRARRKDRQAPPRRAVVVLRAWLTFLGVFVILHTAVEAAGPAPWQPILSRTASLTAWIVRLFGANVEALGAQLTDGTVSFEIIRECTAIHPMLLFIACVAAYPCGARAKLWGLALGLPLLLLVNEVRLVSLFYIGRWFPDALEFAHMMVWQSLIIFATVLLWVLWAMRVSRGHERSIA